MVRAVNGYRDGWRGEGVVYIGRRNPKFNLAGSPLGNPFKIGVDGDREEVVAKYRSWLGQLVSEGLAGCTNPQFQHLMQLVRLAQPGKPELKLACYCKPLACHGDVVADWIHRLLESHQASPS